MRVFGIDIQRAAKKPTTGADDKGSVVSASVSTRSYDSPLGYAGYQAISAGVDMALYTVLPNALPFIDSALRKLSRMIVPFTATCDNETTETRLNDWLRTVTVGDVFRGITPFSRPYCRQALQYGKTAGEIVLSQGGRCIEGLEVISAPKIRLLRTPDGLQIGETNAFGQDISYPDQSLITYSALNREGDNPHGVSLLRSIPYVADCVLRMEQAVRQTWQRSGAPSFFIHYRIPDGAVLGDAEVAARRDAIETSWYDSQEARYNGEGIMDFVAASQGDITFQAIGADVKELNFLDPYRAMTEQILSTVELAPFMLGLQWSTTERLSQQQADCIIGAVDDYRTELEPDFLHILDWVQRVNNWPGSAAVKWADVNLQDRVESAKAAQLEAQTQQVRTQNALTAWANGFIDQDGAAVAAGYEDPIVQELDAPVMPGAASPTQAVASAQSALWATYP